MAKLVSMFMVLIALQAAMILFAAPSGQDSTDLWSFVYNTDVWSSGQFLTDLLTLVTTIGVVGIIAGTALGFKTDFLALSAMIAGLFSIGSTFTSFANILGDELRSRFFYDYCPLSTTTQQSCAPVSLILAITIGPLAFYYMWLVIEWWRGKDY